MIQHPSFYNQRHESFYQFPTLRFTRLPVMLADALNTMQERLKATNRCQYLQIPCLGDTRLMFQEGP
jgi:hypothetical protein